MVLYQPVVYYYILGMSCKCHYDRTINANIMYTTRFFFCVCLQYMFCASTRKGTRVCDAHIFTNHVKICMYYNTLKSTCVVYSTTCNVSIYYYNNITVQPYHTPRTCVAQGVCKNYVLHFVRPCSTPRTCHMYVHHVLHITVCLFIMGLRTHPVML